MYCANPPRGPACAVVADKVRVVTKHNDDKQYVWESMADGSFTVAEDPRGNTLGRGSEITLFLKEEANDMASEGTLRNLVKKYSEFVSRGRGCARAARPGVDAAACLPPCR